MTKMFYGLGMFCLLFSTSTFAGGKWLDYGNGMINLNNVSRISTTTSTAPDLGSCEKAIQIAKTTKDNRLNKFKCSFVIEFDNFSLTIAQFNLTNFKEEYDDTLEKLNDTMGKIRNFLDDDDEYLKF